MLLVVFALPFVAALLCLALNRVAPTRWLGLVAATALLAAAATLLLAQMPLALPVYTWVTLGDQPIRLPIGLLASLIGALALLAAALLSLDGAPGTAATPAILGCWTLVGLLAFGAPPFHALFDEPSTAPAALSGALLPLALPLLGGYAL